MHYFLAYVFISFILAFLIAKGIKNADLQQSTKGNHNETQ